MDVRMKTVLLGAVFLIVSYYYYYYYYLFITQLRQHSQYKQTKNI